MRTAAKLLKVGTKTQMRYPRTGELKSTHFRPPGRPQKFQTWLSSPLQVFIGHFRRLRRERYTKPARVRYYLRKHARADKELAKELGL